VGLYAIGKTCMVGLFILRQFSTILARPRPMCDQWLVNVHRVHTDERTNIRDHVDLGYTWISWVFRSLMLVRSSVIRHPFIRQWTHHCAMVVTSNYMRQKIHWSVVRQSDNRRHSLDVNSCRRVDDRLSFWFNCKDPQRFTCLTCGLW